MILKGVACLLVSMVLGSGCAGVPSATRVAIPGIIEPITPESCEAELVSLLALGGRAAGNAEETARVLTYLEGRLQALGYETRREAAGSFAGTTQFNLLAQIRGEVEPEVVCELGAHYDAVARSPGADDNGSGVVGLLEVARVLADHRPERTLRFCLFAAEEVGLRGSRAHVTRITERTDQRVDGLLNLEMIGYATREPDSQGAPLRVPLIAWLPRRGDFLLVAGNFPSGGLGNRFERCIDRYVPELRYYSANRIAGWFRDSKRSDHAPYWEAGLHAILLSDTAEFRNTNYHRPTDTAETLDFVFLSRVARAAAATMVEWGGRVHDSE